MSAETRLPTVTQALDDVNRHEPFTYTAAEVGSSWLHVLYGYAGIRAKAQALILQPAKELQLAPQLFKKLQDVLERVDCEDSYSLTFADISRYSPNSGPGKASIAIIIALRVPGARDAAGRDFSSFKHAIIASDRTIGRSTLARAAKTFIDIALRPDSTNKNRPLVHSYYIQYLAEERKYVQSEGKSENPRQILINYMASFKDLGSLDAARPISPLPIRSKNISQVVYVKYQPQTNGLRAMLPVAAHLAADLYNSSNDASAQTPWATIELANRLSDPLDGLSVRFVSDLPAGAPSIAFEDLPRLEDVSSERGHAVRMFQILFEEPRLQRSQESPPFQNIEPITPPKSDEVTVPERNHMPVNSGQETTRVAAGGNEGHDQDSLRDNPMVKPLIDDPTVSNMTAASLQQLQNFYNEKQAQAVASDSGFDVNALPTFPNEPAHLKSWSELRDRVGGAALFTDKVFFRLLVLLIALNVLLPSTYRRYLGWLTGELPVAGPDSVVKDKLLPTPVCPTVQCICKNEKNVEEASVPSPASKEPKTPAEKRSGKGTDKGTEPGKPKTAINPESKASLAQPAGDPPSQPVSPTPPPTGQPNASEQKLVGKKGPKL